MATPVPTHPQETLRRAQRVEIFALRQVNDAMVGAYLSRYKGRGTDFEELREYVPGDDVRALQSTHVANMLDQMLFPSEERGVDGKRAMLPLQRMLDFKKSR